MSTRLKAALLCSAALLMAAAATAKPLSAINWLSRSVEKSAAGPAARPLSQPAPIDISVLGATGLDAVGLLPGKVTGLPKDLWQASHSADLAQLLKSEPDHLLPALQELLYTLVLAEANPPGDAGAAGEFLIARVDRLLDYGAIEQAQALLQQTGIHQPALFRRWFDVELLLGQEQGACEAMIHTPEIAPTLPARIFCLARTGDWSAAEITLTGADALGLIKPEDSAVLTRFLNTASADQHLKPLPPPSRPSPLLWRMMEAVGQPIPTNTLPVAFAHADLRSNIGWKAQVVAAERLARNGAIPPNQLIGIYTQGKPSASGEPWDRVAAVQKLDAAVKAKDAAAVSRTLGPAWKALDKAGLAVPLAGLYGKKLAQMHLAGQPGALAFRIGLLSPDARAIAGARIAANPTESFLIGLARGHLDGLTPPDGMGRAVAAAFAPGADPGANLDALLAQKKTGEAILRAIARIADGSSGDLRGVTAGLALLRKAGLQTAARHTALQLMLIAKAG